MQEPASNLYRSIGRMILDRLADMPIHLGIAELCHSLSWSTRLGIALLAVSIGTALGHWRRPSEPDLYAEPSRPEPLSAAAKVSDSVPRANDRMYDNTNHEL
jgi:hypothetical protein